MAAEAGTPHILTIDGVARGRLVRWRSGIGTYRSVDPAALLDLLPLFLPPIAVGRIEDEVRRQKDVERPGLLPLRSVEVHEHQTLLSTSDVDGPLLADRLDGAPWSVADLLALAIPILEALGHAHERGLVHGDFGPAHVILGEDEAGAVPWIRSFGVLRAIGDPFPYDPTYVSPEILTGAKVVDARADLYAAGVLFHEIASGRAPFEGSLFEVLRGHVEEPPPSLRGLVPPEVDAAITKALSKRPDDRWPDAASFADALRGAWTSVDAAADGALDRVGRLQRTLSGADDDGERYRILLEIGDVWRSDLDLGQKALEAYAAALEARPADPDALRRISAICTTAADWERAARALERVLDKERDPGKRARHLATLGALYRDRILDADRAVRAFDRALDESSGELEALEAIGQILTERRDWTALEACYRKMLDRIEGEGATALEVLLWNLLGELYTTWLGRPDAAADAYAAAARLDPTKTQPRARLADLYAALPGREADAVAEHEALLARDPLRVESYRALFEFHWRVGAVDAAWCAAAVLAFLEKATPHEREVFDRRRPHGVLRPRARLDDERWIRWLFHPDEDVLVGKIVEALTGALRATRVREISAYGLRRDQRSDPQSDTVALSRTFGWVAPTLGLATPALYLQPDRAGRLVYVISDPPASVAGADLLSGHSPQELAFVVARHLAFYRGEHYARWILPKPDDLRALVLAGLRIGAGMEPPAEASAAVRRLEGALADSPVPIAVDLLRAACRKVAESGRAVDVDAWIRAVDLTATRAGFLLTGDLRTAVRAIDADASVDVSPREQVKELLRFCASSRHVKLREFLGVEVTA